MGVFRNENAAARPPSGIPSNRGNALEHSSKLLCMETGKKIAIGCTVAVVLVVGGRLGMIAYQRHQAATAVVEKPTFEWKLTDDDMVHLKHLYPSTMKDAKDLIGKRVWISAGGQMEYFPYAGKQVQWSKKAGTLLGAQPM